MTCERARRLQDERLDGPIDAGDRDALEAHLLVCRACARRARQIERLGTLTAGLVDGPAPDVAGRVLDAIAARGVRSAPIPGRTAGLPWTWPSSWPLQAACIVGLLCVLIAPGADVAVVPALDPAWRSPSRLVPPAAADGVLTACALIGGVLEDLLGGLPAPALVIRSLGDLAAGTLARDLLVVGAGAVASDWAKGALLISLAVAILMGMTTGRRARLHPVTEG